MAVAQRVQTNLVARHERNLLNLICRNLPYSIKPDHLTLFGIFGAFVVFAGYIASWIDHRYLWLSTIGFIIHWAGDSLDGSLARFRRVTRPRYGYFVDHSIDAFSLFVILIGLGLSPFVRMDVALFFLVGYLMLAIYVFLNNQVTGMFQLTFALLGPTELRMLFIALNTWIYCNGGIELTVAGHIITSYDVAVFIAALVFIGLFMMNVTTRALALRSSESGMVKPAIGKLPAFDVYASGGESGDAQVAVA